MWDVSDYESFVASKQRFFDAIGIPDATVDQPWLFDFQRDLTAWALRRGRAAIFASTGLGKTRMELEWSRQVASHAGGKVLILAPLAVTDQTVREARDVGLSGVKHVREQSDVTDRVVVAVTNYDRLHRFDPSAFTGIVLDESSIIKHHDAKTLGLLMDAFSRTPFRLCATATPSPNDYSELGTHAEFLGVCTRAEMLSEYFCHDGGETQKWRLKGHARAPFWTWVASWGAMVRNPADLGYDGSRYVLPPLKIHHHVCESPVADGCLFSDEALTLQDRRAARRASMDRRVSLCAGIVNADPHPWVIWCDLNDESKALAEAIPSAVEVTGSDDQDVKERHLDQFARGVVRSIVTKPKIAGFGLNWQHASRMAFVGVTDSWEAYYQAVRRCWRFGQTQPVHVHIFTSEAEGAVVANLERKEEAARVMAEEVADATREAVRSNIGAQRRVQNTYNPTQEVRVPSWLATEIA